MYLWDIKWLSVRFGAEVRENLAHSARRPIGRVFVSLDDPLLVGVVRYCGTPEREADINAVEPVRTDFVYRSPARWMDHHSIQ